MSKKVKYIHGDSAALLEVALNEFFETEADIRWRLVCVTTLYTGKTLWTAWLEWEP